MPHFRSSFRILAYLTFALAMVSTFARADWPPVAKEDLEFKDVPGQPGAPAAVLFHEEIDDDTLHFHQVYFRIKILSEAGRKYADVQVPYDKHGFSVSDVKGRTTHADGTVVNFEGKPLDKEVMKLGGYKIHVKTVTLPDVQVGSVIEYQYSWRYDDNWAVAPEWILQDEMYQKKAHYKFTPTHRELVDEKGNPSNGLAWVAQLPKGAEIKNTRDQYYELTLNDVPPFIEEEYMPPAKPFKWHAYFYYRWATRKEEYWKDKGKGWYKSVEKFIGKDDGVRDAAAKLVLPTDTAEQKARKIYAFVQTLENTSYLPQKNLEELKAAGYKPNTGVDDVLRQKRGSRNQITRLYAAMCRSVGIPAYLMWVTDRGDNIFVPEFLSVEQLDEEIVYVTLDGKEVALDPGTKFAPYGTMNWRYTGSKGLKEDSSGKAELADSPMPIVGMDAIQRAGSFLLSDDGTVSGTAVIRFYGQEALSRRLRAARTDAAGSRKQFEDEVKEWLPSNSEVTMVGEPNWTEYERPLGAQFKISAPILTKAGKRVMMASDFFVTNRPAMFPHAERRNIVYFHHSSREVDDIRILIPASMEIENVTPGTELKTNFAIYKIERSQQQRFIQTKRNLEMGGLVFKTEDYAGLKGFYDKVKEGDDQQVLLRSTLHAQTN